MRNGALLLRVNGQLDGVATLELVSNGGRDRRVETISGRIDNLEIGGAEEWVDDLIVKYVPGTANAGKLELTLACGQNLPPKD